MQFLKTLFWVVIAVGAALFAKANWVPVTVKLWGGLQADVKLPLLAFIAFLFGFVPMFLIHRARVWSLRRRLDTLAINAANLAQMRASSAAASAAPVADPEDPARVATDSKAWPAT